MLTRPLSNWIFIVILLLTITGCGGTVMAANSQPVQAVSAPDQLPARVVGDFYNWYLDYIGVPCTNGWYNELCVISDKK